VVRGHRLDAQTLAQVQRHAFDQSAGVDEDQRRPVRAGQLGDAIVELAPLLVGADGAQLILRYFDRQVEVPALADVDHFGGRACAAHQQLRGDIERPHRRRKANPLQSPGAGCRRRRRFPADQRVEPLQRERQVGPTLVGRHGVDLVDDHRAHVPQRAPTRLRRQEDVQRLGGRDEDVRRAPHRFAALAGAGVAGADGGPDLGRGVAQLDGERLDLGQRLVEIPAHVVGQRLERRHVKDTGSVGERPTGRDRLSHQAIERPQEGRQGLAGSGGRRDQNILAGRDERPGLRLRRRRRAEAARQPALHHRVKHPFSVCGTLGGFHTSREEVGRAELVLLHAIMLPWPCGSSQSPGTRRA
jgi:hypothetical protein